MKKNGIICSLLSIGLLFALASMSFGATLGTLPVAQVVDGRIRIDGDLSEWRGMPMTVLDGRMDHLPRWRPASEDRAVVRVAVDGKALNIGLHILDDVYAPHPEDMLQGDHIRLYLDVRPVSGPEGTALLGHEVYSPGCYQIVIRSPLSKNDTATWQCVQGEVGTPQHLEVAAQILDGAYTLEVRIPFEELNHATPDRFTQPIGLSVRVHDLDDGGTKGSYSLAGPYVWRNPGSFWRAVLAAEAWDGQYTRYYEPQMIRGSNRIIAGVISTEELSEDEFDLACIFSGTDYDRDSTSFATKPVFSDSLMKAYDPVLGLYFLARIVEVEKPIGGRYAFVARFDAAGNTRSDTLRGYYREADSRLSTFKGSVTDSIAARSLIKGFRLTVWPNHVYNDSTVRFRTRSAFSPQAAWYLSERAEKGDTTAAFQWRLDITELNSRAAVIRTLSSVVTPGEVLTSIDPSTLPEGLYSVRAHIVAPNGSAQRIWYDPDPPRVQGYTADRFLAVHRQPVPTISTEMIDNPNALSRLRLIGTPGRHQFSSDNAKDCHGRSVWDLQLHDERIYVGIGNGFYDLGPVDIWSYEPVSDAPDFKKEITVDEEAVSVFRDFDGRLLVPGTDATESWEFGNLYVKEAGKWRKLRTVPNGIHVLGVAVHRGNLFVTTGTELGPTLYESDDAGQTWMRYDAVEEDGRWDRRFYEVGVLGEDLMLTVGQEYVYRFRDGELTRMITPIFPGLVSNYASPFKVTSFMGGLLYAPGEWWATPGPEPLYFMRDLAQGAAVVSGFQECTVRDILVRDGTCYVLTSTKQNKGYFSEVHSTRDMKTWHQVAQFHSDAIAYSLERAGERFFIGMATLRDVAIQESGNIYVLE